MFYIVYSTHRLVYVGFPSLARIPTGQGISQLSWDEEADLTAHISCIRYGRLTLKATQICSFSVTVSQHVLDSSPRHYSFLGGAATETPAPPDASGNCLSSISTSRNFQAFQTDGSPQHLTSHAKLCQSAPVNSLYPPLPTSPWDASLPHSQMDPDSPHHFIFIVISLLISTEISGVRFGLNVAFKPNCSCLTLAS